MKRANGIVLDKPGKPDYSSPSSFRIIVLLETVSKILERIAAYRLAAHARMAGLIDLHQCGSLAGLGCSDAVLSLQHEVRLLQSPGLKVSSLFLDIKGGFNNVNPAMLLNTLRQHHTPTYLSSWIVSFLSNRCCRLIFQGSPMVFSPVSVGTPQGSPISPLLFVIYVAPLHRQIPQGLMLSYVDDFAVTVASPSYRTNIRRLQDLFYSLRHRGGRLGIAFSIPKTELIHWRTSRDRSSPCSSPIALDGLVFHPSQEVRWLGFWFTPTLNTSAHFHRRLSLAWAAFGMIKRLSPAGKGLSPWCNRKLAAGLLFPILSYGGDVLTPNATIIRKLDSFWHAVLRWVTNCFRDTPKSILYVEASLPPLDELLAHKRRLAALRLVCSPPTLNPATARLHPNIPTWDSFRAQSNRHLLAPLHGSKRPPRWPSAPSGGRRYLPIDALAFTIERLLTPKLPVAHPHLLMTPYDPEPGVVPQYSALKKAVHQLLLTSWSKNHPTPTYYRYLPSTVPHPFMALPRFMAGRLHQMRSGHSHLAAHRASSWDAAGASPMCPSCEESDEDLDHALLHCPAKACERSSFLQGVGDLGHGAPLWDSTPLLLSVARYISSTATGFPPAMPPTLRASEPLSSP